MKKDNLTSLTLFLYHFKLFLHFMQLNINHMSNTQKYAFRPSNNEPSIYQRLHHDVRRLENFGFKAL